MARKSKTKSAPLEELFNDAFLKKIEYLYIVSQKIFTGRALAKRKTKKVSSGIEFADHRAYSPGDDLRNIDWKIYARSEKLLVRLFEEEEDLYIYFLLDTSLSMTLGEPRKMDYARRLVAALSYVGLSNMDRVSIIPFNSKADGRFPPSRGKGQIFKIFDFLRRVPEGQETDMREAFRVFAAQNRRRGIAVVVSDLYDPNGYEDALNILRYQKFETYVIHLVDEAELRPNLRGDIEIVDCETHARRRITVTPRLLERYRRAHSEFCGEIQAFCMKRNMLYLRAPIQTPFDDIILKVFRAGGFVQ